jgi:hypothetical protein
MNRSRGLTLLQTFSIESGDVLPGLRGRGGHRGHPAQVTSSVFATRRFLDV